MRCERALVPRLGLAGAVALCAAGVVVVELAPRAAHAQQASEPAATARAGEAFGRGREAFDRGDYDTALREFRAAVALVPSPNTRLYIARSLRGLGRNAEAYAEFARCASEADTRAIREPRYAPTAAAARADARGLLARVAIVNVLVSDAPPGAVVRLNGASIDRADWNADLPFEPGPVQVDAEAPGRAPFHSSPTLSAGMVTRIEVHLAESSGGAGDGPLVVTPEPSRNATTAPPLVNTAQPPAGIVTSPRPQPSMGYVYTPPPRRPSSPLVPVGGIALGLGLAAELGAVIAGVTAQSLYDDLMHQCGAAPCPADTPDLEFQVTRGRNRVLLTNVLIASGAIAAALGVVLIAAGRAAENSAVATAAPAGPPGTLGRTATPPRRRAVRVRLDPVLDPLNGIAGVSGAF